MFPGKCLFEINEELFGPVLTIHVYDEAKWLETLDLVDSTSPYALTGAIFAQDRYAIEQGMQRLRNAARDGVKITRVAIDADVSPYKITLLTGDGIHNPANNQPRRARLSILEINAINAQLDALGVPAVATW